MIFVECDAMSVWLRIFSPAWALGLILPLDTFPYLFLSQHGTHYCRNPVLCPRKGLLFPSVFIYKSMEGRTLNDWKTLCLLSHVMQANDSHKQCFILHKCVRMHPLSWNLSFEILDLWNSEVTSFDPELPSKWSVSFSKLDVWRVKEGIEKEQANFRTFKTALSSLADSLNYFFFYLWEGFMFMPDYLEKTENYKGRMYR